MKIPEFYPTTVTRRDFINHLIRSAFLLGSFSPLAGKIISSDNTGSIRRFHVCLQPQAIKEFPELPSLIQEAGVTDIWLAGFLYGRWYQTPDELKKQANILKRKGFRTHIINVPLGHPGDALGVDNSTVSHTPPGHWKNACTVDGKLYSGTSIHAPAKTENVQAIRDLQSKGFDSIFLDDDFRVARSPGQIGGCFCETCRHEFLDLHGYKKLDWDLLLESVTNRNPTFILRQWIDYWCNKLYDMYVELQAAAPEMALGIMVMYLGSEKAGIALDRFRQVPFRVGELMFNDKSFDRVKGKTDELFSSLFHRRFTRPDLAYSETTAYPADQLSANNMAAKLSVSLISDVRHTMFMSGLKPFPVTHWQVLGPAMKKSAGFHEKLAGHRPQGPFKHYWGWDSRLVGEDKPFSLFLALGIPFEVVDELPADGWIFLSDEDARAVSEGRLRPIAGNLVARPGSTATGDQFVFVGENLDDLFALKKSIRQNLKGIPYVEEDIPVVFSWYPTARAALVWNLVDSKQPITIRCDDRIIGSLSVEALDVELITNMRV